MKSTFNCLIEDLSFIGDLKKDSQTLLIKHNRFRIAEHSLRVAKKARMLAQQYGVDEKAAEIAGLLHDIGGVYPNDKRVEVSNKLKLDILPEEEELPLILHQKISVIMAQELFDVQCSDILSAIGCHTTLKVNASPMDMILFVADKIEWDQDGIPPYSVEMEKGINISLEAAAFTYFQYLWENQDRLKVIHPWLIAAYKELQRKLKRKV